MDKKSQVFIFQNKKPKINAYRAIRGDGLEDAEKFADDVLANFRIPAKVNISALRRASDKAGEFILVECKVASNGGMFNNFYLPFRIRKGRLMPPSVVSHENLGTRVLAQSTFDDIFKRCVSVPFQRHVPFNNGGGQQMFLQELFSLFASSEDDTELLTCQKATMKEDCWCSNKILKKGDKVFIEGVDPTDYSKLIVFCSEKNARYSVLKEKVSLKKGK